MLDCLRSALIVLSAVFFVSLVAFYTHESALVPAPVALEDELERVKVPEKEIGVTEAMVDANAKAGGFGRAVLSDHSTKLSKPK